jgi:YD repeat-containing protein
VAHSCTAASLCSGSDDFGNVTSEQHADGGIVQYRYDAFGDKLSERDADGELTTFGYDSRGNLASKTTAADVGVDVFASTYGATIGIQFTGHQALTETYAYDEMNRRTRVQQASGRIEQTYYDARGDVRRTIDAGGLVTDTAWDAFGHKTSETVGAGQAITSSQTWTNDAYGRVLQHTSTVTNNGVAMSQSTSTSYSHLGDVSHVTGTSGQNLTYTYDNSSGRLVKIEDDSIAGKATLTQYAWDQAGNRTREKTSVIRTSDGAELDITQDNHIAYDALNRVSQVQDAHYSVHDEYDAVGNRVHEQIHFQQDVYLSSGATTARDIDHWSTFDAMNRQTIVDGAKDAAGNITVTTQGQQIAYDDAGKRIMVRQQGKKLVASSGFTGAPLWGAIDGVTTESYAYDAAGRLVEDYRDGLDIDSRRYDADGRLLQSGLADSQNLVASSVSAAGIDSARHFSAFDVAGRLTNQSSLKSDGSLQYGLRNVYDNLGRLTHYTMAGNGLADYDYAYASADANRLTSISGTHAGKTASTVNVYDANGYLVGVQGHDESNHSNDRTLQNDVAGRVLRKTQDGHVTSTLIANDEVIGSSSDQTAKVSDTFTSDYVPVSDSSLTTGPQGYTVQAGETLQSIAKNVWGNADLWWVIADANGISDVTAGEVITLPPKPNTLYSQFDTATPYNSASAVGDTTPNIPLPSKHHSWFKELLEVAVVVDLTVFTAGAASIGLEASLGSIMESGTAFFAGTAAQAAGVGAAVAAGGAGATATAFATAVGNIGVGALAGAAGSLAGQGIGAATGLQHSFSWQAVAASAVGAGVGQAVGGTLGQANIDPFMGRLVTGLAAGGAAALARGGRVAVQQVAVDAFGNAIGSSLADQASSGSGSMSFDDLRRSEIAQGNADALVQQGIAQSDAIMQRRASGPDADGYVELGNNQFMRPDGTVGTYARGSVSIGPLTAIDGRQVLYQGANGPVYAAEGGTPKNGLLTDTNYAVLGRLPSGLQQPDGTPLMYTFDSTGTPFWRASNGTVMSIPIPFARPELASLQASAAWDGFTNSVTNLPSNLVSGAADLLSGNVSVNGFFKGIYDNSPVGMLGAAADDNYRALGARFTGTAVGLVGGLAIDGAMPLVARGWNRAGAVIDSLGPDVSGNPFLADQVLSVGSPGITNSLVAGRLAVLSQEGHALERHGGSITDEQLMVRAYTGVAPDGSYVLRDGQILIPPSSSAFNSDALLAQSDLLLRQGYLDRAIALSRGATSVTVTGVDVGSVVGRGFDRVTSTPGGVGPLQYFDNLTKVTGSYRFDAASGTWRTVTIYPTR